MEMLKGSPASSLEYLITKLNEIPDLIRNAQTAQETALVIETLTYIRKYFLKGIIEDLHNVKHLQDISLPEVIDIDRLGTLWEN